MQFLIDECLALDLETMAVEAGYFESAHVSRRGMAGLKDHELMARILDEDWTLVTRNSDDFRPAKGSGSTRPCYMGIGLHAGLICLNLPNGATRVDHRAFFRAALDDLGVNGDLTNQVIEVWPGDEDSLRVDRYAYPVEG
jgi:hypothetical protein